VAFVSALNYAQVAAGGRRRARELERS
jgi:hypothetical protein